MFNICNDIEKSLTYIAAVPFVGSIAALSKILMGTAQVIIGLAAGILTIPLKCMNNTELNDHCWTHLAHGLGNIVSGATEVISILGTILFIIRLSMSHQQFADGQSDKFMPYYSCTFNGLLKQPFPYSIL